MKIQVSRNILNFLRETGKKNVLEDQDTRVSLDLRITKSKLEFVEVIRNIQAQMLESMQKNLNTSNPQPHFIELGAGVIPMSLWIDSITSTDVVDSAHLDGVLDATELDLPDQSIDGLFLQNTFHHVPDPAAFFNEAHRVLRPGGRIVMVDPYYNFLSRTLYKRLFATESFDMHGTWRDASEHAMIGANQALTYIVFVRDQALFKEENPKLKVIETRPLRSGLRYLLTGGLNFRRIAPLGLFPFIAKIENRLDLLKFFSIHWIVVIEKIE